MSTMRARMMREVAMLENDPPYGISAWPKDDQLNRLEAQILGPEGSPYEDGVFRLDIEIPEHYPFEPPKVLFITPIYHPNIDDAGRICLDTLKMQPKGSWLPSVNISTLLTTIRLLMAEPNADDGLMPEITELFKHSRELFNRKAIELTRQHARAAIVSKPAAETPKDPTVKTEKVFTDQKQESTAQEAVEVKRGPTTPPSSSPAAQQTADDALSDDQEVASEESDFSNDEDEDEEERHPQVKRQRTQ